METALPVGFIAAQLPLHIILGIYGSVSGLVISFLWIFSGKHKFLSKVDRLLMCWFAFSGLTHIFLEGYFVFGGEFYKIKGINFFAEVWKEFNNGDSRYAARDPSLVVVEAITSVLVGPACLWSTYAIATRKPWRYTIQILASVSQLYGDIIYFGMPWLLGKEVSKPGALYFWFYYVFMNGIWVVVPFTIVLRGWKKISNMEKSLKKHM